MGPHPQVRRTLEQFEPLVLPLEGALHRADMRAYLRLVVRRYVRGDCNAPALERLVEDEFPELSGMMEGQLRGLERASAAEFKRTQSAVPLYWPQQRPQPPTAAEEEQVRAPAPLVLPCRAPSVPCVMPAAGSHRGTTINLRPRPRQGVPYDPFVLFSFFQGPLPPRRTRSVRFTADCCQVTANRRQVPNCRRLSADRRRLAACLKNDKCWRPFFFCPEGCPSGPCLSS